MTRYINLSPETFDALESFGSNWTTNHSILLGAACTASFLAGFKSGRVQPLWRRITNIQDVPSDHFGPNAPYLRGRVVSVTDGDTFRFWHVPTILQSRNPPDGIKLSATTIPVRVVTIDTPETAKFGKDGQPFGEEAKEHLSSLLSGRTIKIQLLQKDQYGRVVAQVKRGHWGLDLFAKYADEEMLKAGFAEVYLGGGAVYGRKGKEAYLQMQEHAKEKKKGIWSLGDERESAADYKARMK